MHDRRQQYIQDQNDVEYRHLARQGGNLRLHQFGLVIRNPEWVGELPQHAALIIGCSAV